MTEDELHGVLEFLRGAEQLKDTLRNAHTSEGRHESTAEHTWRLCLMVLVFEKQFPDINILRLLKMCIIHDLGEAINGDVPATEVVEGQNKAEEERRDLQQLIAPLTPPLQEDILSLWDEYELAESQEAILAKGLDKLETILQHTQGKNPEDFNYVFNLTYGKNYTDANSITSRLRQILDRDTERLAEKRPQR